MLSPTVTYLPRTLEPISRDTFNDATRVPPAGRPSPGRGLAERPNNVIELRPAGRARTALAAA